MITSIFRELLYKESLANYIDDFVILVKTKEELENFKRLKYNFNTTEIPILGVQVGNRKV